MKKDISFPDGAILVIGGTGGIGSEVVKIFADCGCPVIFTYKNNNSKAEELVNECSSNSKVFNFKLDIIDSKQVSFVIEEIIGKFNRIHTIINCAGFDIDQKIISELSADSFNEVMQSDVQGFFNIVNSTLGHLSEKGGSYIFMSSAGLLKYPPGDILSVAPKAAIEQLIKGIAKEEGANNIRANSIALGIVDAGIFHRLKHQNDSFFDEDWESELMNALPLKRYASPREVAELTLFLASNEAGYITGQMIAIDGGYSI